MIKITRYTERQPIPDEHDDCPDSILEDEWTYDIGFKDLVNLMRDFAHPSTSHPSGSIYEWFMSEPSQDFRTGDYLHESLHFAHDNHPRAEKYWAKAMRASGLIK